jgi:hypothetical protein
VRGKTFRRDVHTTSLEAFADRESKHWRQRQSLYVRLSSCCSPGVAGSFSHQHPGEPLPQLKWVPQRWQVSSRIDYAGGENLLSNPGEYSTPTTWDTVLAEEPVIAACGFDLNEAAAHAAELRLPVRTVVVDGGAHYSRPAPRLADGVQQLGYLLHPGAAPDPGHPHVELSFAGRHGG